MGRKKYDWAAVQGFYDAGHSYRACMEHFGFTPRAWHKARKRGEIQTRALGRPLAVVLREGKSRWNIKQRLLRAGILENRCEECGLSEWRSLPLAMHIDHINGIKDDHRIENLRMLCPNCHSQTQTYGGRNIKRRRRLQDLGRVV